MKRKSIAKILLAVSLMGLAGAGTILSQPKTAEASTYRYSRPRYIVSSYIQVSGNRYRRVTRYNDGLVLYSAWQVRQQWQYMG